MSGGHFEYNQSRITEITDSIQKEIDNSGCRIPIKDRMLDPEYYNKYPNERYYAEYSPEVLKEFKIAVLLLTKAAIYAQRIDWYLSGDDGEESFLRRLDQELEPFEKEETSLTIIEMRTMISNIKHILKNNN
jgi:hypothetical protein